MSLKPSQPIQVFSFGPAWGTPLPSIAPFPLKLEAYLRMVELPYKLNVELNSGKGPKGKSPWIEDGSIRMGDTELIIAYLKDKYQVDLDAHLSPEQKAVQTAWLRLFEEHYHQIWEHHTFIPDEQWKIAESIFNPIPMPLRLLVKRMMRKSLNKQLHQRGVGRHRIEDISAMGIADLNAASDFLGNKTYFLGEQPSTLDACAFGFIALSILTPMTSPIHQHARSLSNLVDYCNRIHQAYFPEFAKSNSRTKATV